MSRDCRQNKLKLEKSLLGAIEEGLLILGDAPRKAIYFYLETKFQLKRENIPRKTGQFAKALDSIFGPGAEIIERCIIKDLYQRLRLNLEEKAEFGFVDYIKQAQLSLRQEANQDLKRLGKHKR